MEKRKELTPKEKYDLLTEEEKYRLTVARFTGDFSTLDLVYRRPAIGTISEPKQTEE